MIGVLTVSVEAVSVKNQILFNNAWVEIRAAWTWILGFGFALI